MLLGGNEFGALFEDYGYNDEPDFDVVAAEAACREFGLGFDTLDFDADDDFEVMGVVDLDDPRYY